MSETDFNTMAESTEKPSFDLNLLQSRIEQIKEEGKESSEFVHNYIKCLMDRHDLQSCMPNDTEIQDIPDSIIQSIIEGEVPTIDALNMISEEDKNWLLIQLVWICGMAAIAVYCDDEETDDDGSTFDAILSMMDVSEAHFAGCYLICALALLMCKIPPIEMIEAMTDDFSDRPEIIQRSKELFYQLSSGIYSRYEEDLMYYGNND
jgi:hypothetical protein